MDGRHHLAHAGQLAHGALDAGELDALAAQLHLAVEAAAELEVVPARAHDAVAAAVMQDAVTRHESLGGQLGPAPVAARHLHAADPELALDADGERVQVRGVDHGAVHAGALDADGHARRGGRHHVAVRAHRHLRRAVVGIHTHAALARGAQQAVGDGLAADDDGADGGGPLERSDGARHAFEGSEAGAAGADVERVEEGARAAHLAQGRVDAPREAVEDGVEEHAAHAIALGGEAAHEVGEAAVLHHDSLGSPRCTRRVHDVHEGVGLAVGRRGGGVGRRGVLGAEGDGARAVALADGALAPEVVEDVA